MSTLRKEVITFFNSGNKLFQNKLYSEALTNFEEILKIDYAFYEAHFGVAKTLIKLKEVEKGISYFRKYLSLIPKLKYNYYTIKFSQVLCEEKEYSKALIIMDSVKDSLNNEETFDYVEILLLNHRIKEAIHLMINIKDLPLIRSKYDTLINNLAITNYVKSDLTNKNIIPKYLWTVTSLEIIKVLKIPQKRFINLKNEISTILQEIKDDINCDYTAKFNTTSDKNLKLQEILVKETKQFIKVKKIKEAKEIVSVLSQIQYNSKELKSLSKSIQEVIDLRNKKNTKIGLITTCSFIVLLFFGMRFYKKSEAYEYAVYKNNFEELTKYLEEYGDDEKIHELREKKIFQMARDNYSAQSINLLNELYPTSKLPKIVKIITNDTLIKPNVFILNKEKHNIKPIENNTYKVPKGFKIGYSYNSPKKVPILHHFTVADSLLIKEKLKDSIVLYFEDDFSINKSLWDTFNIRDSLDKDAKKENGVKLENGSLKLHHQSPNNQFIRTKLDSLKLEKNINFQIEITYKNNYENSQLFFLFGANEEAFNYVSLDAKNFTTGYQILDKKYTISSRKSYVNTGNNILKVTKQNSIYNFHINDILITTISSSKWFGNQIGFGINNNGISEVSNFRIYQLNTVPKTNFIKDQIYYCWTEELNVRQDGSTKGKILTTLKLGEPVKYLGLKSDKEVNATFNNMSRREYYCKVELVDGTIGWVHGGALNKPNTNTTFNLKDFKKE